MRISKTAITGAVAAVALVGSASAAVTLTGDPTTSSGSTWNLVGSSLQSSNVIWAAGSTTRDISYYTTAFTYSGGDSSTASMGNASGSIGGAGWAAGDRVVAVGWKVNNGASAGWLNGSTFMKFNPGGAGTYSAANAVGGTGGSTSFGNSVAGDFQLYGDINWNNESRVTQYRNRTASGSDYPLQVGGSVSGALLADPFRSYSVLAAGTTAAGSAQIASQIYLINVDFLARAGSTYGFAPNMIGDVIGKLHIQVGGFTGSQTDVVLTNVAVPAPGALALLGVAGLAGSRRRR